MPLMSLPASGRALNQTLKIQQDTGKETFLTSLWPLQSDQPLCPLPCPTSSGSEGRMGGCSALQATKIHHDCCDLLHLHPKCRSLSQLRATTNPKSQMPKQLPPVGKRHRRHQGPADPWLMAKIYSSYSMSVSGAYVDGNV